MSSQAHDRVGVVWWQCLVIDDEDASKFLLISVQQYNRMGNCCHPELLAQPLAFSALPMCKKVQTSAQDLPRIRSHQLPSKFHNSEEGTKQPDDEEYQESDSVNIRKRGQGRDQNATLLHSFRSIQSKLNHHNYEHFIGPPSSVQLSLIERMENESILPDEVFFNVPAGAPKLHEQFGKADSSLIKENDIWTSNPIPHRSAF